MASRRSYYALYLTRFVGSLGYITVLTLLPFYIDTLGAEGLLVGLFVTSLGIGRTVAIVPVAWAADRFDKRSVLLLSLAVSTVAYGLFIVVDSSLGFVLARGLQGLGIVGTGMVSLALVGDLATEDSRARQIGKYNSWRMAAGIVGSVSAAALYDIYGFDPIFSGLVVLFVLAVLAIWLFVPRDETRIRGFAFRDLAVNQRLLTITSFRAQYAVAVTLVRNWVPIFVGLSVARGGLGISGFALGAIVASEKFTNMLFQPFTGRISDRHGRGLFVAAGGATYGLLALAVPLSPSIGAALGGTLTLPILGTLPPVFFVLLALNGLLGIADAVREPASMALFADEGKDSGITSSFGIRGLVWRPGALLAPLLGGYLMDAVGMWAVFAVAGAAAITGAATMVGIIVIRHGPRALSSW